MNHTSKIMSHALYDIFNFFELQQLEFEMINIPKNDQINEHLLIPSKGFL